jgi:transposase
MDVVVIGVDPGKRSVTIEARDAREVLRATGSFPTTTTGYRAMLRYCRQWPTRLWAVEGARGVGRPLAARLLAEGERVLDVPAKLSARVRVLDAGHGRKTDATDAHAVVMAALRDRDQLRELSLTEDLVVLRLLADRRDELSRSRAQALNRLHRLMTELVPGGIPTKKSVPQYQTMLARVRPRDVVGRTVRRRPPTSSPIGPVASSVKWQRRVWKRGWSHGQGKLAECRRQAERRWHVGGEFVVAAAEVLHERMAGGDSCGRAELFQSAHQP